MYKLIVAANRDEFYNRPTSPAMWWEDAPSVLAGKDLEQGGTWMGMTKSGRFAAITNYRDSKVHMDQTKSRGCIVSDYLKDNSLSNGYVSELRSHRSEYKGYNLIWGDVDNLFYYSNRIEASKVLEPGLYGLSNHLLDTPWPKVLKGKKKLEQTVSASDPLLMESLLSLLEDTGMAPDSSLPETGIGIEWERILSPIFIKNTRYGTRSSTVILVNNKGEVTFKERSFIPQAENSYKFRINP